MVQDLKDFMAKVQDDKALQDKMAGIIKESTQETVFDNCNAVAAEMGYTITEDDMQTYADEYQSDLNDDDLDKVAGGVTPTTIFWALSAISVGWSVVGSAMYAEKHTEK